MGAPGHGKTVALLDVAQHLTDDHRDRYGLAVLFNLGSWRHDDDDLLERIVHELSSATGPLPGADDVVRRWAVAGRIAPILDGLDEIADPARRRRCVLAINRFIDRSPESTALVVASRPHEYTEITAEGADRLAVNAALELGKLRRSLVVARLREAHAPAADRLAILVERDPAHPVVDALRVPLWLWIAGSLGPEHVERLPVAADGDQVRRILTTAYLDRAIAALDGMTSLGQEVCRRVLAAIAGFLADPRSPDSTTFRFEDLTPPQPTPRQVRLAVLLGGLAYGVAGSFIVGLGVGLTVGLSVGVVGSLARRRGHDHDDPSRADDDGRPARSRIRWPDWPPD